MSPSDDPLAGILERNIRALVRHRKATEAQRSRSDRWVDAITQFTGSLKFVYIHFGVFSAWVLVNLPGSPILRFDPTYVLLATWASVEAIFLSTFVLITQNRASEIATRRDELNLQISLLAEYEITHLIQLVEALAKREGLGEATNPELAELKRDVAPEKVLDRIDHVDRDHAE
jgi:uncharacterized membrane protein